MEAPTTSDWITQWQWSWVGIVLALVLACGYLLGWFRARRDGEPVASARLCVFLLAVLLLIYVTCGPVGVFSTRYLWIFALRIGLLNAVVPLGLSVGRPVEILGHLFHSQKPRRWVAGPVARVLMFPAVSSVLAAVSVFVVFYTGYGQAAATSAWVDAALVAHMVFVGLLVVLPLLGEDMLPGWATPGVRTLIASLDGLLDALPGILVMTSSGILMPHFPGFHLPSHSGFSASLDQKFAGGALLAVAESIGIPMLIAVFIEWMRADERSAHEADRVLDAQEAGAETTTPWWLDQR